MADTVYIIHVDDKGERHCLDAYETDAAGVNTLKQTIILSRNRYKNYGDITWETIKEIESLKKSAIILALKQNNWSKTLAAKQLGIKRTTLIDQISRMSVDPDSPITKSIDNYHVNAIYGLISGEILKGVAEEMTREQIKKSGEHGTTSDTVTGKNTL